jgi:hypothetical protein
MSKISEIAKSYLGQKEISGNKGFVNKDFDKKMRSIGFYSGAPWCGFFALLVYTEAKQSIKLLSASSARIIEKATTADNWHAEPKEGAVVVWATFKNGERQATGHIGIVTEVKDAINYTTAEGNTTDKGGREGIMVALRNRHLTKDKWTVDNGLRLMGFVYPEE